RAQQNLEALLGENLEGFLGNLLVGGRQELVHGLNDGYFGAQTRPDRTQLQTNDAGANHTELLRHALEIQGASRVDDDLLVHRGRRNVHRRGAGCQDDILRSQSLNVTIQAGDFDLLASQQLAVPFEHSHTISLHQRRNTTGEVFDDLILARDHRRNIHGDFTG